MPSSITDNASISSDTISNSSIHNASGLPEIIRFYNKTKSGVDIVDRLCDVARKTNRWPWVQMFYLINICCVNSKIIYDLNNAVNSKRKLFLEELAQSLMQPWLIKRATDKGVPTKYRKAAAKLSNIDLPENNNQMSTLKVDKTKRNLPDSPRCRICKSESVIKRTRIFCHLKNCKNFACNDHMIIVCRNCFNSFFNAN